MIFISSGILCNYIDSQLFRYSIIIQLQLYIISTDIFDLHMEKSILFPYHEFLNFS